MMAANRSIKEFLAWKYRHDFPDEIYILMSEADFDKEVMSLAETFAIKPLPLKKYERTIEMSVQQYIADCVARAEGAKVNGVADFEHFYGKYYSELQKIYKKHGIPESKMMVGQIDLYIVVGGMKSTSDGSSPIRAFVNKRTRELVIKISERSSSAQDFREIITLLYAERDRILGTKEGRQPAIYLARDSEMSRIEQTRGMKAAIEHFEFRYDKSAVQSYVKRIRDRRRRLIKRMRSD